ncbi:MAG: RidA family protein, partial [Pseudomonadota bacterium]
ALSAFALSLALPACAQTSIPQTAVAPPEPEPRAENLPYSPVIVSGETIYLAGHLGFVPGTRDFPRGGIGAQTTQTLENIGATLETVDATHADLVRCQVFLTDPADFDEMNTAYRAFFPETPPARTTVAVALAAPDALIEIECTGVVGHGKP